MNRTLITLLSWVFGALLGGWGVVLVVKFFYLASRADSVEPFWHHIVLTILVGVPFLLSGIFLLFQTYRPLKRVSPILCLGGAAIFGFCAVAHLISPTTSPRELGFVAVCGLGCALGSSIGWVLAAQYLRSNARRRRYH